MMTIGRASLIDAKKIEEDAIVITHGTKTMAQTAKYIGPLGIQKTIILTGSMKFGSAPNSDAPTNMHDALHYAVTLPHGVYIRMNGIIFPWNNVKKNTKKGIFEKER